MASLNVSQQRRRFVFRQNINETSTVPLLSNYHLLPRNNRSPSPFRPTMDSHIRAVVLHLLVISSLLSSISKAETSGSVLFVDNPSRQYFRSPSTSDAVQSGSISIPEIGAAVSVLLGLAPPASLSAASSSKLNEVLKPNPFDRPRAVFMLEVAGVEALQVPVMEDMAAAFITALKSEIVDGTDKAQVELPGEEVSVVSLDERSVDYSNKEISDFASWLGGLYALDTSQELNGVLTIPTTSDGSRSLSLHMSKKAHREFVTSLLTLLHNARRAVEMHEDLTRGTLRPAELMMGTFEGIKALREENEPESVVQQGLEILFASLSKLLESLQEAYKGKIIGVIFSNGAPSQSEKVLSVMLTSQQPARWLEETTGSINTTIARVALVRITLAWLTGIILIIATLLGIYFLLNMPLTRDTLLYSNVKLD